MGIHGGQGGGDWGFQGRAKIQQAFKSIKKLKSCPKQYNVKVRRMALSQGQLVFVMGFHKIQAGSERQITKKTRAPNPP